MTFIATYWYVWLIAFVACRIAVVTLQARQVQRFANDFWKSSNPAESFALLAPSATLVVATLTGHVVAWAVRL